MQIRSLSLTMALARRPLREAVEPQEFDKTGAPGLTRTWFSTLAVANEASTCVMASMSDWTDGAMKR
jgi:hypothetical protein